MPVVRHHHEACNGAGYPGGPERRRDAAAARDRGRGRFDRRDSSDRPYRKGIRTESLMRFFVTGGKQWELGRY